MKFETQVFHADFNDDPATSAVAVPMYRTTSYSVHDSQHGADLFNLAENGPTIVGIIVESGSCP